MLVVTSVPLAVAGSLLGRAIGGDLLKVVLRRHRPGRGGGRAFLAAPVVTSNGRQYSYRVCRRGEGRLLAGIGGAFVGLPPDWVS